VPEDTRAWNSLQWRLPLLMALLMAIVVAAFLAVAYRQVRANLRGAAATQMQAAADQMASLLAQSTQQRAAELHKLARHDDVRRLVQQPDDAGRDAARARLAALAAPTNTNPQVVEIWTAGGVCLLAVATPGAAMLPAGTAPLAAGAGPLRRHNDVVFAESVTDIPADVTESGSARPSPPIGFLVVRRTIGPAPNADALNRLIGRGATISIGNRGGDLWTDLKTIVPAPPLDHAQAGLTEYRGADGAWHLGARADIRGTPWSLWIEFPSAVVLAPARAFLQRMLVMAVLFVLVSAVAIRIVTGRITTPLYQLTVASEAMAAGDYSRFVQSRRRDEIGRLSAAFDAMRTRVAYAQRDLEERVQRRTARLEETSQLLAQRVHELDDARNELHRFFSLSLDLLCIADSEGRFVRVNPAWESVLGWTEAELTAAPYIAFVHPDDRAATEQETLRLAVGGVAIDFVNRYRHKDGSYRWLSWKAASDPERGVVYAAAHDITALQQAARDAQQHATQLAMLNRELESFSYSVSHDLRAPLRHVTGFAMMLQQSATNLTDDQRRKLTVIADAAARMGRLIDDLLAFSRVGRTPLSRAPVDLNRLVRDAKDEATHDLNGRVVKWSIHDLPSVTGDASLLRQVVLNLLTNALKYSQTRGETRIEVGAAASGGDTVVFVRDNGVGFDMQYADKLFGVFQRLHSSDEFEGTGIGLANVQRIVQRHGGRAWAEGQVDGGATFYFSLPNERTQVA
jgi:PAS domain S-box-containing protein